MIEKPLILIVNDDGISAPGIRRLINLMNEFGDILAIAPDGSRSGMSHAITLENKIVCTKIKNKEGYKEYSCSGTPVDCVKLAVNKLLPRKPDLCVSGINHGSNSSINVIYSGTMAAAIEGYLEGVPSIGFSLLDISHDADFTEAEYYVRKIVRAVLDCDSDLGCLNVNIPKRKPNERIKGIKICRQSHDNWVERFKQEKFSDDITYYWMSGDFINYDQSNDTDEYALSNHYVSIVPVQFDLTAHNKINLLNQLNL